VHPRLWKVLDSAHPQLSIEYAAREHAIDCARVLATENAPSLVEVLSTDGRTELRERYLRTTDGFIRVELAAIDHDGDGGLRSTAQTTRRDYGEKRD
jgi:hypothetical protein